MFGEKVQSLRKKYHYSQDDLANRMNISRSTVAMWETAQREPDFESVKKLAQIFGVTTDYLLGNTEKPDQVAVEDGRIGKGWIAVIDSAKASGLSPEDLEAFIKAVKRTKPR